MKYFKHLFDSAAQALVDIFEDQRHADKVIEYYFRNHKKWGKRDRHFFAETVYECVRWWNLYEFAAQAREDRGVERSHKVMAVHLLAQERPLPDWYEGTLNIEAVLKRLQQPPSPELAFAVPQWLYQRGLRELGEDRWHSCLEHLNQPAPVVLRVNTMKVSVEDLRSQLAEEGIEAEVVEDKLFPHALKLLQRANVFRTDCFKKGYFEVQDGSSQQVGFFLSPQSGERVIDACAGAGGKTLHLATLMENKGRVVALDIHGWKLDELKKRSRRNGISVIEPRLIESTKTIKRLKGSADALLLDVPCSGVGVLKRNPDSKWKLNEERLDELNVLQFEILENYQKMVKAGGRMVYSTCSLLPSENQDQIKRFLESNPQWKLEEERTCFPGDFGFDGFYMARLSL